MFLVGLTGGIASGKSSVIQVFQQLGCAVIDVDVIARHVVQPGYPAHRRIVEAFGTDVLLENGDIDRKILGDLIFNQPDRRHLLNSITHPEICNPWLEAASDAEKEPLSFRGCCGRRPIGVSRGESAEGAMQDLAPGGEPIIFFLLF